MKSPPPHVTPQPASALQGDGPPPPLVPTSLHGGQWPRAWRAAATRAIVADARLPTWRGVADHRRWPRLPIQCHRRLAPAEVVKSHTHKGKIPLPISLHVQAIQLGNSLSNLTTHFSPHASYPTSQSTITHN